MRTQADFDAAESRLYLRTHMRPAFAITDRLCADTGRLLLAIIDRLFCGNIPTFAGDRLSNAITDRLFADTGRLLFAGTG